MTVEDIYNRLMNGESDTDIAADLVAMLNEAVNLKMKNETKESQKKEAAAHAAEVLNEYFSTYTNWNVKLTGEDIEAIGRVVDNTKIEIINEPHKKGLRVKTTNSKAGFSSDEAIDDFLASIGLK